MIRKFTRLIKTTQSKYKAIIEKKDVTQQCSYNLELDLEDYLLSLNALTRITPEGNNTNVIYEVKDDYSIVLNPNIIAIIGEKYLTIENKVLLTHTEGANGTSKKIQLKKTDYDAIRDEKYEWFIDLYNKNIENILFITLVDDESKTITFDLELSKEIFVNPKLNWQEMTYTIDELANILKTMSSEHDKVLGIHLFGIRYGAYIKNNKLNVGEINARAGIGDFVAELHKGIKLSSYVYEGNCDLDVFSDVNSNGDEESDNADDLLPTFDYKKSSIRDGRNLIVYGTPGCGKSYHVQYTLLKGYPTSNYIRTTFFQDYTNTDFVGQILPVVEGDKVTYEFNPGPFTLALEQAIRKPNENVALVIEELNRGSAASIFGDIFQLLDRKEGVSEYAITNVNILNYLKKQFEGVYTFEDIRLPGNLSIFATMNTSDQNVFTLDTAFKRRWEFKKLINKFESDHTFKDMYIPNVDITWKDFVDVINLFILESSNGLNSEDKQLGVYFVNEKLMRKDKDVLAEPEKVEAFAYKVLEYLWSDVAKFDRSRWFEDNIKSLDMLVEEYKSKGIGVFKHGIFNK